MSRSNKIWSTLFLAVSIITLTHTEAATNVAQYKEAQSEIEGEDKSQDGVTPVTETKGINKVYTPETMPDNFFESNQNTPFTGPMGLVLPEDFGESKYDSKITPAELFRGGVENAKVNLEEARARYRKRDATIIGITLACLGLLFVILRAFWSKKINFENAENE